MMYLLCTTTVRARCSSEINLGTIGPESRSKCFPPLPPWRGGAPPFGIFGVTVHCPIHPRQWWALSPTVLNDGLVTPSCGHWAVWTRCCVFKWCHCWLFVCVEPSSPCLPWASPWLLLMIDHQGMSHCELGLRTGTQPQKLWCRSCMADERTNESACRENKRHETMGA